MKWEKSIVERFSKVRKMINEGIETPDYCMEIMYAIESCCDELTPDSENEWIFYDDFRDLKAEIHEEVEYMDEEDYETCMETVNYYLSKFYDLCDIARVWLGI